ncbi:dihydrolipoamide acetyltransferase family protein [Arthrobacter glacialis]|uniref:Dihydrolipoamide acetyltransferase component of pyruvate dehydrogenase complex n=1 Tax=Arthrobacter glacialis TaxID=1664 RepID=A0A2S3ZYM8_ARTGL|nr:dihydrolipoamide acetyltransferase family protein [Arthrobacter glacialis]POH74303.1 branched-chain alpha-keto acid dehydrogenase subunit E2 [Arthrobacter glacialis]
MSLQVFLLPDLGEGLVEAELVTWLVNVGDAVHVDQPIAEVETAKSVVEVPSPFEGVVETLHGAEGDTLTVGKPLISVNSAAAEVGAPTPALATSAEGSGNVLIGYGTSSHGGPGRTRPALRQHLHAQDSGPATVQHRAHLVVSPLVRKLAHDHGLELSNIHGSGSDGLILRRDVEQAAAGGPVLAPAAPEGSRAVVDQRTGLEVAGRTPLTGVKKAAAAAMTRSRAEIPEATVWVDVDATALMELRRELKAKDGAAPSVLAFVARFVTAGLGRFPALNMQVAHNGPEQELVEFAGINLGIAAQTERGLMVPVVRNVQGLSARALDERIRAVAEQARGGKAGPETLRGGTFTINNYGVFGVDGSAAIINYQEAAMLGIGRIMDKPWVVNGELCVRQMTELTLAFDHRVCDGAVAAGFLRFVADAMENPASVLADL